MNFECFPFVCEYYALELEILIRPGFINNNTTIVAQLLKVVNRRAYGGLAGPDIALTKSNDADNRQ